VNELRDLITKLVEQELKDEIDKNKELIEHAKEQLDIKLKQLEAEKELADFSKDRAKQEQNIAKITSKIESLRVAASQGDARAINEINQLEEQRAELQENLDEAINERSFELRKENLQNQFDEFERIKNEEIKLLEDQLNDAGRIIELANKKMSDALANNMGSLYQELVNWNSVYGTGFENDVLSKWEKAIGLVQQYNSVIGGSGFNFGDFQSSGGTVGSKLEQVKAEMRRNSDLWWQTEDADEKRRLNERNKALAKSIGYSYNPGDGRYYSDKDGSMLVYDNGGYKPKGVSGFMAEGVEEWVLKDGQIKAMQEMAMESLFNRYGLKTPSFDGSSSFGDINVNIYGDISDNNVEKIRTDLKDVVREVSRGQLDSFKTMGYVPKVKIR
jgi:hypothetical protein